MAETNQYDAFISYRRQEPDQSFAHQLWKDLESAGYRVAIDERDFAPPEPFLQEMERCIKQSRFTLAVVSPQYFSSGNCEEEAIICKVRDMRERERRLVPLTREKVKVPDWMYGITGIDFTNPDPLIPPFDRLKQMLGNPQ
jgi:hypothetical protein